MNDDLHLSPAGANLIKAFEGLLKKIGHDQYKAYVCPAGVTTIGWGTTAELGRKLSKDTVWTKQQCDDAFLNDSKPSPLRPGEQVKGGDPRRLLRCIQEFYKTQGVKLMATKTKEYNVTGTDGKVYSVTATASGEVNVTTVKPLSTDPIPPEPEPGPEPETNTIPLSFDDPMFTGMTEKHSCVTLSSGQNLSNTSIEEQSGNPTVVSNGGNTLTKIRVRSRECIRITDSDLTIENAYLEAQGTGDDHADTLQAYSPGARGSVTLRNVHVRAYTEAATAGYFSADYWSGTITCENVIFQGGPFGIRVHSDTDGHIDLSHEGRVLCRAVWLRSVPVWRVWRHDHDPPLGERASRHHRERQAGRRALRSTSLPS